MIKPVSDAGSAGYVPLCAALQWLMSDAGTRSVMMDDQDAWKAAVDKLWPLVSGGEIELNGLPRSGGLAEQIPSHGLTLIRVLPPLQDAVNDFVLSAPSHISCTPYIDKEHWSRDFNDRLYVAGQPAPAWTHLQLRKADLLSRWPRPEPTVKAQRDCYGWLLEQMKAAPSSKPKSREAYWSEAMQTFRRISKRQFGRAWDKAIIDSGAYGWSKPGRLAGKSNHCGK